MVAVLSPQEQRVCIEQASNAVQSDTHESRTKRILDSFKGTKPSIDVERGYYFTKSFRQTEGEPLILRWAKALRLYAEKASIFIDPDQLIVGRGGKPGRYGILYPELDGHTLVEAIRKLPERTVSPFSITPADARIITDEIAPYWQGRTFHENLAAALTPETRKLTYNRDKSLSSRFIVNETASFRSSLQWVHDYGVVLRRGFTGIRQDAEERLAQLDENSPVDYTEKRPFLEAVILLSDAIMHWAQRHAILAERLALTETDPQRKQELRQIAAHCSRVPAYPARTFHEALQSQWFVQMFSRIEQKTGTIISNGRMDQYLYPYYKQDKEAGTLTDDRAQELLECVWVAMAQYMDLYLSDTGGAFNEGYAHWEAVTVGGQTADGKDAVNDLTYIFLKSKRAFPLNYPDLAARVHSHSSKRYLDEVAETIKDGSGFPKLINDNEVISLLLAKGASREEATDYSVSGCAECRMPNRDTYTSPNAYINFPAALETVFYNGKMLAYGEEIIGLQTGEVEAFDTYEKFLDAYLKQQTCFLRHAFIQQHEIIRLRAKHFATPLGSALHKLCQASCIDLHQPAIPGGIDLGYFEFMGYGTVIDSLAAIKKNVYEDRRFTLSQLKEAMQHNFEGYEAIRQLQLNAPCYGNNDPYADEIGKMLDLHAQEFSARYSSELGVRLDLRYVPFTSHIPFGKVVSASPNGRRAYTPLSDGSSPTQGADTFGPTAVLLSNHKTKNDQRSEHAARLLNVKLSPSCVQGEQGTQKLVQFIESWRDLQLWHIQFNVINKATLVEAQKNPENYRSLLVRIAGYSAYFTDLSKDLQDDIIARTEHASW
jgi:formate C-acetyltransferase